MDIPPLIGRTTLTTLGMLKKDPEGKLAKENELRIHSAKQKHTNKDIEKIEDKNASECFQRQKTLRITKRY